MKKWADFAKVAGVPVLYFLLLWAERGGTIDHWRGLDLVKGVADNFSLSYAADASRPVHTNDPAWVPLIRLIQKYSKIPLRSDKQPQTVARLVATLSTQQPSGSGEISEWTSPSTPFVVFYRYWPGNSGKAIPREDYTVVGTIGDLQAWIVESNSDFHFIIHDVILGLLAMGVGYWVWHLAHIRSDAQNRAVAKT